MLAYPIPVVDVLHITDLCACYSAACYIADSQLGLQVSVLTITKPCYMLSAYMLHDMDFTHAVTHRLATAWQLALLYYSQNNQNPN